MISNSVKIDYLKHLCVGEHIKQLLRDIFIITSALFFAYAAIGLGPLYLIIFRREHATLYGTELPFTDLDMFGSVHRKFFNSDFSMFGSQCNEKHPKSF